MIINLPGTTVSKVAKELVKSREDSGAVALGRVLTLVIIAEGGTAEEAIEAANDASREHPMRVIVLERFVGDEPHLDAEIRLGGDAGASEVLILRAYGEAGSNAESLVTGLLLPDAPVVAWWPNSTPEAAAKDSVGKIAQRRITDAAESAGLARLQALNETYTPGDTDLAWTRLTRWREQLAAVLDQPPFEPITSVEVHGPAGVPAIGLLVAWLGHALDAPVKWLQNDASVRPDAISKVVFTRESGDIVFERTHGDAVLLQQPGQPNHELHMPRRSLRECLAEELRHLGPDEYYGEVLKNTVDLKDAEKANA